MAVYSQNGYVANDVSLTKAYTVPGSRVKLRLRKGDTAAILLYCAAWIDANIEDIDTRAGVKGFDVPDDWGYAERNIRGSSTTLSNHASGTAIDINAVQHGRGVHGTWSASQVAKVDAFLASLDGVVRWGEHYKSAPVDGMHLEIVGSPAACARVVRKLGLRGKASRTASASVLAVAALALVGYGVGSAVNPGPSVPVATPKPAATATPSPGKPATKPATRPHTASKPSRRPVTSPVLSRGSHGASVASVQRRVGVTADGDFGPRTEAAVKRFQRAHGLRPDGVVGPRTWAALRAPKPVHVPTLRVGSRGPLVAKVQRAAHTRPDGIYGPNTVRAVKVYQGKHRLAVDGVAGPRTLKAMHLA